MPNSRTTRPDGAKIRLLRHLRGWQREHLVAESQLAMERLTENESAHGPRNRRVRGRIAENRSAGIDLTTLVRVEMENALVFWSTLWIIAQTLQVPVESLIASDQSASADTRHDSNIDDPGQNGTGTRCPIDNEHPLPMEAGR